MIWAFIIWVVLWMCHAADTERKMEQIREDLRRLLNGP